MNKPVFLAGAGAGVVAAALVLLAIRPEPASTTATPDSATQREAASSAAHVSSSPGSEQAAQTTGAEFETSRATEPRNATEDDSPSRWPASADPEELDKRLMTEVRDDAWASTMELSLGDFLARQPYPNALGSPSIECRATLCRVQSVVDAETYQAAPHTDLQVTMGEIQHDSLGRELVPLAQQLTIDQEHPGLVFMSAYLQRADPPGGSLQ